MDTTLVIVTVLSMGMAAALSVIVWRLLREDRQRSEARIAALQAAAGARAAAAPIPALGAAPAPARPAARAPTRVIDLPLRTTPGVASTPAAAAPATAALFVQPARPSPWGNRLGIIAGLALVVAAGLLFALAAGRTHEARAASIAPASGAPVEAALELLSLRDAHENGALTISGVVHNPRSASLLTRVTVTAYTFDDKGAFLASGRALLDVTSLSPGDDSPFLVTVPVADAVARYRIGFRGEDGRVIGHVDRRQSGPVAAIAPGREPQHW